MTPHIYKQLSRQRAIEMFTSARKGLFQHNRAPAVPQTLKLFQIHQQAARGQKESFSDQRKRRPRPPFLKLMVKFKLLPLTSLVIVVTIVIVVLFVMHLVIFLIMMLMMMLLVMFLVVAFLRFTADSLDGICSGKTLTVKCYTD